MNRPKHEFEVNAMIALIIILPISALLLFYGYLIRFKKNYKLISGFNTMSEEEQNRVDKEKMGIVVSNSIFITAVLVAAGGLFLYFKLHLLGTLALFLVLPVTLTTAAVSQKYYHANAKNKKRNRVLLAGIGVFSVAVVAVVGSMLYYGSRQSTFTLRSDTLTISGMYGVTVSMAEVKSVNLENNLPANLSKSNGFDWNTKLKGHFRSSEGNALLFVDTEKPPFIYLEATGETIIVNCPTEAQTQALYQGLKARIAR